MKPCAQTAQKLATFQPFWAGTLRDGPGQRPHRLPEAEGQNCTQFLDGFLNTLERADNTKANQTRQFSATIH
jgi:hypothetical protein